MNYVFLSTFTAAEAKSVDRSPPKGSLYAVKDMPTS